MEMAKASKSIRRRSFGTQNYFSLCVPKKEKKKEKSNKIKKKTYLLLSVSPAAADVL